MSPLDSPARRLVGFVSEAQPRTDWHEPDEQDIECVVVGDHLDNAFGNRITGDRGFQEFVVQLRSPTADLDINLATLLALATAGARDIVGGDR